MKLSTSAKLLSACIAANLLACSTPHSHSTVKIQNSAIDEELSHTAIIPIIRGREFCTGVALSTTLVMTAQHCIDRSQIDCGVTVLGHTPSACFYDHEYVVGDFSESNAHHDIAVFAFSPSNQVPITGLDQSQFPQMNLNSNPRRLPYHASLTLVGFGSTIPSNRVGGGPIGSGHGVGVTGEVAELGPRRSCVNKMKSFDVDPDYPALGIISLTGDVDGRDCLPMPGDSGGPLLWKNPNEPTLGPTVVGLASTVYYPESGEQKAVYVGIYGSNALDLIQAAAIWVHNSIIESQQR